MHRQISIASFFRLSNYKIQRTEIFEMLYFLSWCEATGHQRRQRGWRKKGVSDLLIYVVIFYWCVTGSMNAKNHSSSIKKDGSLPISLSKTTSQPSSKRVRRIIQKFQGLNTMAPHPSIASPHLPSTANPHRQSNSTVLPSMPAHLNLHLHQ